MCAGQRGTDEGQSCFGTVLINWPLAQLAVHLAVQTLRSDYRRCVGIYTASTGVLDQFWLVLAG